MPGSPRNTAGVSREIADHPEELGGQTEQMARSVSIEPGHFVLRMMEATTGIEPVYAVLQTAP